jgi:integrase
MQTVNAYLDLRRAAGFDLRTTARLLRNFAGFATEKGDLHVRAATAIAWAAKSGSVSQRDRRLKSVIRLARHARAENSIHEVPPGDVFAAPHVRPLPHIFTLDEVGQILEEAGRLGPEGSLRPHTYRTLFGVLASCGLRISEALALFVNDVTPDGLLIRETKFRKNRLVPIHPTTERAVEDYIRHRRKLAGDVEHLFVSMREGPIAYPTVQAVFLAIVRKIGLRAGPGQPGPRIHDLRHTFAVRALEACPHADVAGSMLALSTYLGHGHVADTYWYLQVTPQLMTGIADACSAYLNGGIQ